MPDMIISGSVIAYAFAAVRHWMAISSGLQRNPPELKPGTWIVDARIGHVWISNRVKTAPFDAVLTSKNRPEGDEPFGLSSLTNHYR
jgi:hypothetical protein